MSLADIKVGDRVWLSSGHTNKRDRIVTVERLTPTQIIVGPSEFDRYQRGKPSRYDGSPMYYQISGGMWKREITAIATASECAAWDSAQEEKRQREATEADRRAKEEALRVELYSLLPQTANIFTCPWKEAGDWEVTLRLTEPGVRRLAELLKSGGNL